MDRNELIKTYAGVRQKTESLCAPLETEDYVMQTDDDVSPPNWHLGHTTWFFERVILHQFTSNYQPHNDAFYFVFNSYYESFGQRNLRSRRGTLSRPTVREVYEYRSEIDRLMGDLLETSDEALFAKIAPLVELGLNHEQQHEELLMMDIKHILASNPLRPAYDEPMRVESLGNPSRPFAPPHFIEFEGGISEIGANGDDFSYDNERPRHRVLLEDFALMDRLVTNGEFLEFIKDGGYRNPLLWLSDGWNTVQTRGWTSPLYWEEINGRWYEMALTGFKRLNLAEPVCHEPFVWSQFQLQHIEAGLLG